MIYPPPPPPAKQLKEKSEVKRAGQQMQKVINGSARTTKASSLKNQRSKPHDRPRNNRFNVFKRRPFLVHGRALTQTKASNPKKFHKTQQMNRQAKLFPLQVLI